MFERLSSVLLRASDYSAICREYSKEDESYVMYMLTNDARDGRKVNTRKSA